MRRVAWAGRQKRAFSRFLLADSAEILRCDNSARRCKSAARASSLSEHHKKYEETLRQHCACIPDGTQQLLQLRGALVRSGLFIHRGPRMTDMTP